MLLYLETNFLVGDAFGQDDRADDLVALCGKGLDLALPAVCVMEAWSTLESREWKQGKAFLRLKEAINADIKRDKFSIHAACLGDLLARVEEAIKKNNGRFDDAQTCLRNRLRRFAGMSHHFQLLPLTVAMMRESVDSALTEADTDNLLLTAVLSHATGPDRQVPAAFLSGNAAHFGKPEVQDALQKVGVAYFATTPAFLEWFKTRQAGMR